MKSYYRVITALILGAWPFMSFGVEKFYLNNPEDTIDTIMIRNIGSKDALRAIGVMMEEGVIRTHRNNDSNEKYFIEETFVPSALTYLKPDETLTLSVNGKSGTYIPFVSIDKENFTAQYGIANVKELTKGRFTSNDRTISVDDILGFDTDPNTTVLYVTCPKDRNELCSLKIKHKGQWYKENSEIFELPVLARSRRERGKQDKSFRLLKDGDTPQGIYHLWGTLFTVDRKFGAVPRIDIDGMQPPINFQHAHSPNYTRIVPKETFRDYWVHEFPLAFSLGRYLFRIHDNSVDPLFPDTYTTPDTNQTFRASAGCINTGTQMEKLLRVLVKLDVLTKEQIQNNKPYGRIEAPNIQNSFLVVIDE